MKSPGFTDLNGNLLHECTVVDHIPLEAKVLGDIFNQLDVIGQGIRKARNHIDEHTDIQKTRHIIIGTC